jgi:hypothetical protein
LLRGRSGLGCGCGCGWARRTGRRERKRDKENGAILVCGLGWAGFTNAFQARGYSTVRSLQVSDCWEGRMDLQTGREV